MAFISHYVQIKPLKPQNFKNAIMSTSFISHYVQIKPVFRIDKITCQTFISHYVQIKHSPTSAQ